MKRNDEEGFLLLEKIRTNAKDLKHKTYTLYLVYKDKRIPIWKRLFLGAVIGYAVSPIDLIPDFIPIIGYLDDLILIPVGLAIAIKLIPKDIMYDCEKRALENQDKTIPLGRTASVVIILIWIIGIFILFNWIYSFLLIVL